MQQTPQNPFLSKVMPFIAMGIFIVLLVVGVILLSYVLLWGAIIGLAIFLVAFIKSKLFPSKHKVDDDKPKGRIIDHDDVK